jgi:fatty acid desaturase
MLSLIFILLAATALVVGGTVVSLFLHTRRVSGSRIHHTSNDSYSTYATMQADMMSRYARNALVILLFGLIVIAMIIFSIINGLLR